MHSYSAIYLFSGAGGMDLVFINAGFNIIWNNDNNKNAVKTYSRNIGKHIYLDDIKNNGVDQIANNHNEIDLVISGFLCQGFNLANYKRSVNDQKNDLYLEIL